MRIATILLSAAALLSAAGCVTSPTPAPVAFCQPQAAACVFSEGVLVNPCPPTEGDKPGITRCCNCGTR